MAQQLQSPETYAVGQQLTAARLNNMVNNAVPLPGLITDRPDLTANTVATGDSILLHDVSASALVEATASDLLNSNIAITTSSITAGAGSDITITPQDGTIVTGSTFTSADGLTTVVTTSVAHGLSVGQVVTISAATQTGYNGTHRITAVTTVSPFTFTYVMTTAGTVGSGTLSYLKQGVIKNPEHQVVNGNLYVDGSAIFTGTTFNTGAVTNASTVTNTGTVTQSGTINITGVASVTTAPTTANHITNKTYVDGTVSKTENGYVTLPNGLIMQWGTVQPTSGSLERGFVVTFPIAFPNACLNATANTFWNTGTFSNVMDNWAVVGSSNTTTLNLFAAALAGHTYTFGLKWFAIGY